MAHGDVKTRVWRNGVLEKEDFPLADVSDYLCQPDCLVWADLCSPDQDILDQLAEELSLDRHAVEDALEQYERPKATRYSTHTFVTAFALEYDSEEAALVTGRVSAFVVPRGMVSVRLDTTLDIGRVVQSWDDNADMVKFGAKFLLHGLLDDIVDGYFTAIDALDTDVDALEDALFDDRAQIARDLQRRTFALRKALTQVRRSVVPMREVVNTVMRRSAELPHGDELAPFYEDLYDHVLRAADWTDTLRDMISSIFETNLSLSDLRMNLIMKKLTSWAAIIAVPTAITGYFGQNVPYPGFGQHWGFWTSTGSMVLIAFALWLLFRRKDWL